MRLHAPPAGPPLHHLFLTAQNNCILMLRRHGYGEGGRRAPHQDYKHYKYFGLAGRGAATSWGANPSKQPARRLE